MYNYLVNNGERQARLRARLSSRRRAWACWCWRVWAWAWGGRWGYLKPGTKPLFRTVFDVFREPDYRRLTSACMGVSWPRSAPPISHGTSRMKSGWTGPRFWSID